jgi:hypothetical protein
MKPTLPLLAALFTLGCTSQAAAPATVVVTEPAPAVAPAPVPSAGDLVDHAGDSPQTAISVPADAPDGGVDFENRWIFERFGRFRRNGGGTGTLEGRRYNIVKIELANGERQTVYFDITENWAKWQPPE